MLKQKCSHTTERTYSLTLKNPQKTRREHRELLDGNLRVNRVLIEGLRVSATKLLYQSVLTLYPLNANLFAI